MRSAIDQMHGLELDPTDPYQKVILALMDTPAIQRMKYVSQLSAASWVYPDGIHSRFGHVVGSSVLAADIISHIHSRATPELQREIEVWGPITVAFAMTHDLGHIAPGSHVAHYVWYSGKPDSHEEMSHRLLKDDPGLRLALEHTLGVEGAAKLDLVVAEDPSVPKWAWQLITAGGWNADRGDWVLRDSHHCGVGYGHYEVPIIKKNLTITKDGELAIREAGVSALEAFFSSRADMYRNVYRHPVCQIGEQMHVLVGQRARELFARGELEFCDETMAAVLASETGHELNVPTIMNMVESWWQYHLIQWERSGDKILSDLSGRVMRREPFKRFRKEPAAEAVLRALVEKAGFDPNYFVMDMAPSEVNLQKDLRSAIKVLRRDGSVVSLTEHSALMQALNNMRKFDCDGFIAVPQDVFRGIRSN
jgi:HD superfamily phosphohydrolase